MLLDTAYLFTDITARRYFSGVSVDEGVLVIFNGKSVYFTDARYNQAVKEKLQSTDIESRLLKDNGTVKDYVTSLGAKSLAIDYSTVTVKKYNEYKSWGLEIIDSSEEIVRLRSIKKPNEIKNIKKACEIAQKCFYLALPYIKEGVTEEQIKEKLNKLYKKFGAEGETFSTIVAFGKNSAIPHHETGKTKLKKDTVVLIDTGCIVNGYRSDLTRTLFFGTPDKEFVRCYDAVLSANEKSIEFAKEGVECSTIHQTAVAQLKKHHLDEFFTHSLGHGVGLEIHESPTLSAKSDVVMENDMVFTIEPGVYINGKFGIRIEDTVVMENGKAQRLFTDDKKLIVL